MPKISQHRKSRKIIWEMSTNSRKCYRHPANIITNIMFCTQAKQIGTTTKVNGDTIVSKAEKGILEYTGTHVPIEFVTAHRDSWQAHLEKNKPIFRPIGLGVGGPLLLVQVSSVHQGIELINYGYTHVI